MYLQIPYPGPMLATGGYRSAGDGMDTRARRSPRVFGKCPRLYYHSKVPLGPCLAGPNDAAVPVRGSRLQCPHIPTRRPPSERPSLRGGNRYPDPQLGRQRPADMGAQTQRTRQLQARRCCLGTKTRCYHACNASCERSIRTNRKGSSLRVRR